MPRPRAVTLDALRTHAVARSLFAPTTLSRAVQRLGFVQADPIRAPARAQDLTLRPRVARYRAGDLEASYEALGLEEDVFINYGFMTRAFQALMHPRRPLPRETRARARQAEAVLAFVRERGAVHPREVERYLGAGTERNFWGGLSNTTTRLLESLHYRGEIRVVRREAGIRIYGAREAPWPPADDPRERVDALVEGVVGKYAPLPERSLRLLIRRLRYAAPQWSHELSHAIMRARERLGRVTVEGTTWYFPAGEKMSASVPEDAVRLLAPFDPIVWDRYRFELLWDWQYRFEAYTPRAQRKLGYYALPLLFRDRIVGWGNVSVAAGRIAADLGFVSGQAPRDAAFRAGLERELADFERFLTPRRASRADSTRNREIGKSSG